MNNKDLHHEGKVQLVRFPGVLLATADGIDGTVIDRANYGSVEFIIVYGAKTTGGIKGVVVVKEGSATGSLASAADGVLLGTELAAGCPTGTTDGTSRKVAKKIGYIGNKRYVTVNLKATGGATMITAAAVVLSASRKPPHLQA